MTDKEKLLNKIKKLDSYHEIQNTMGRLTAALNFQRAEEILSYFALDEEDVSLEYADEGVFEGKKAVEAVVHDLIVRPEEKGYMLDMQLTTPMIEVADDVKTAKALWWCPGISAVPRENEDPQALWCWGMVGVDFINKGNEWKVWHLHYFRFIRCDYHKGWVEDTSLRNRLNTPLHPLSKPSTYHDPYSYLSIRQGIPACPRPYASYEERDRGWMLNTDKER
ncbi:MAG: nuclear transport factor 2 family protein [Erysipelotrichaceae bacterium]|nr:nuclear transport factor 2 family protein [Erysipelotrichaceae bacterium]